MKMTNQEEKSESHFGSQLVFDEASSPSLFNLRVEDSEIQKLVGGLFQHWQYSNCRLQQIDMWLLFDYFLPTGPLWSTAFAARPAVPGGVGSFRVSKDVCAAE